MKVLANTVEDLQKIYMYHPQSLFNFSESYIFRGHTFPQDTASRPYFFYLSCKSEQLTELGFTPWDQRSIDI